MYSISIPKPCHAGWDNMLPVDKGRYCSACAKTVIDFSILSDAEVQDYFTEHFSEQICGHFKASQLQRIVIQLPGNAIRFDQPFWKRFLVLCLLIFGTTVFPFETVLAGIQTEQTQQTLQSSLPEKKQKKARISRKRKKRIMYSIFKDYIIDTKLGDITFAGYTRVFEKADCRPGQPIAMPKDSTSKPAYRSSSAAAEKENGEGGSPPKPPFESVFILPPSLTIKKQLPKNT